MRKGYFSLVLHAHLPYIRHQEAHRLEERWMYEAISETYIPLLWEIDRLERPLGWTISISPPVIEMLADSLIQDRYVEHLEDTLRLIEQELQRDLVNEERDALLFYKERYHDLKVTFEHWGRNLNSAFRHYKEQGYLELMTCTATHGFSPHMLSEQAARSEIQTGLNCFERHYGYRPTGLWMPECAYTPGLDKIMYEEGIRYTFVDEHSILNADPAPKHGIGAPVYSPHGVALFPRDQIISGRIWSSVIGYPGHPDYREFYRDLAYDREWDQIAEFMHPEGLRYDTGLKLHRVTGESDQKEYYVRDWAWKRTDVHATDFAEALANHLDEQSGQDFPPFLVTAPFDAELFGHWWFEGPDFLGKTMERFGDYGIESISPAMFLERHFQDIETVHVSMGTWGRKGYADVWINERNDWMIRHLHQLEKRLAGVVARNRHQDELTVKAKRQLIREYLLAVSSDWPFILDGQTTAQYAANRFREHIKRFEETERRLDAQELTLDWLEERYAEYPFLADTDIEPDVFLTPHDYYVAVQREASWNSEAILLVTTQYDDPNRPVAEYAKRLAASGENVYVITSGTAGYQQQDGVHVYQVGVNGLPLVQTYNQLAGLNLAVLRQAQALNKIVEFRLVHNFNMETASAAQSFAEMNGLPLVSNVYDLESERSPSGTGGLVVAIKRLEGEALRHSDVIYLEREEARNGIEHDYHVAKELRAFQVDLENPYQHVTNPKKNG
ncbi:1,4-alpha-glucan branching protein domain-containing protein [Exiguobacterium artemiae]|uniref:1,4-alpha-glucan branching protein domain-containing protein n=1 Tax=Exiguobacterium artemiae TaxID=340145 RepID=UPI00047E5399|nr:1,4-alpha-glucan branching protein domain-containing protein [Exiguobacterium sibiricum]